MMKKLTIGAFLVITTSVLIFLVADRFDAPREAVSQVSQVQMTTIFSASSTAPGMTQLDTRVVRDALLEEEREIELEIMLATSSSRCVQNFCPSILGTQDRKLSSPSGSTTAPNTGGTFLVSAATTSLLMLDTSHTKEVGFLIQRSASGTPSNNRNYITLEASNDGLNWYPYNFRESVTANTSNTENATVPFAYPLITQFSGGVTTTLSYLIWVYNTANGQTGQLDVQRTSFMISNVLSKWMRIGFSSAGTSSVRVEATLLTPI